MKKSIALFFTLVWLLPFCIAQEPAGYYNVANGKKGHALRVALFGLIKNHTTVTYSQLWDKFPVTDKKQNGKVWDIYSDVPNGTPPYEYTFGTDQCGQYSGEGDCYNREHSMPKSWFGGQAPMESDLFHIYPTDGHVNGKRSNMAYGEVSSATWTSQNGSKIGHSSVTGYSGTVFEPIDEYKGDLARSYFYMVTRYMDKNLGQEEGAIMLTNSNLNPWALTMLIRWHNEDPVSPKEIARNNAIYLIQHNRNPFIDHPELVGKIFGVDSVNAFIYTGINNYESLVNVFPNPATQQLNVSAEGQNLSEMLLYDMLGKCVKSSSEFIQNNDNQYVVNVSDLSKGLYILKITIDNQYTSTKKIIIQ